MRHIISIPLFVHYSWRQNEFPPWRAEHSRIVTDCDTKRADYLTKVGNDYFFRHNRPLFLRIADSVDAIIARRERGINFKEEKTLNPVQNAEEQRFEVKYIISCCWLACWKLCSFHFYSGKGGKNRRRGKNENESEKRELVFKEDGQGV